MKEAAILYCMASLGQLQNLELRCSKRGAGLNFCKSAGRSSSWTAPAWIEAKGMY
jgi:hypothetical protein